MRKIYYLQKSDDYLISNLANQILDQTPETIKSKTDIKSKAFDLIDVEKPTEAKMIELSQRLKKKVRELMMYESWLKEIVDDTKFISSQTKKNNYLYLKITYITLMVITIFLSAVIFLG